LAFGQPEFSRYSDDSGASPQRFLSLKKAIDLRDKITHPKNIEEFEITEEELIIFEKAAAFYRETTLPLIE
jgi:hypothetical protein